MAANGKNWYDALLWVEQVIKSCKTPLQEMGAKKLVKLYLAKYKEDIAEMDLTIYYRLMTELDKIKYERI